MNAIEDTVFSRTWTALGSSLPKPGANLLVSAHWMSQGSTLVDISEMPRRIQDFYGFPDALYKQSYSMQDPDAGDGWSHTAALSNDPAAPEILIVY